MLLKQSNQLVIDNKKRVSPTPTNRITLLPSTTVNNIVSCFSLIQINMPQKSQHRQDHIHRITIYYHLVAVITKYISQIRSTKLQKSIRILFWKSEIFQSIFLLLSFIYQCSYCISMYNTMIYISTVSWHFTTVFQPLHHNRKC